MGVFHYRCALTGMSLRAERALLFWVWRSGQTSWSCASLPIRGTYDQYGRIDGIKRDFNTKLLTSSWEEALESGHLVLTGDALHTWRHPNPGYGPTPTGIDRVIQALERGTTIELDSVKFAGQPLAHMLVAEPVFDAVVKHAAESGTPSIAALFPNALGQAIYGELARAPASAPRLAELHAFAGFFSQHAKWRAASSDAPPGQFGGGEELAFYLQARRRFAALPWMVKTLEAMAGAAARGSELEDYFAESVPHASWFGLYAGRERAPASSNAGLRDEVEALISEGDPARLLDAPAGVLIHQHGCLEKQIDLRPMIRLVRGPQHLALGDPAALEFLTAPGTVPATAAINWDELEQQLPLLQKPIAPVRSQCLAVFEPGTQPDWVTEKERWSGMADFGSILETIALKPEPG